MYVSVLFFPLNAADWCMCVRYYLACHIRAANWPLEQRAPLSGIQHSQWTQTVRLLHRIIRKRQNEEVKSALLARSFTTTAVGNNNYEMKRRKSKDLNRYCCRDQKNKWVMGRKGVTKQW